MDHNNAVYGVDVSKAKLVTVRYDDMQTLVELDNRAEAIAAWLANLPKGTVVAMEATGIYHRLLAHLAHAAGMRVYVLNPQTLKHYAQAIGQRAKTDGCDARMIARYALHEQAKLQLWQPPARAADRLSQLLERRHTVVGVRQTLAQSLSGMPVLNAARQSLLASLERTVRRMDILIRHEMARLPGAAALYERLTSIVGIGPVVAAQLVALFSTLRFARTGAFIAYTGLDPRPNDSGARRGRRTLSKHGPPLLRCLLYNAGMAAANSKVFKPVYQQLRARGLHTTEAIVVLARKIARIAFALYKSGEVFDAQKHLRIA
ncbi:MAG: IS110 family transposase [Betaproteobacteria bacterium]|nr:MAG: IS110 family transposase [Betaproteobacteria bacterium]